MKITVVGSNQAKLLEVELPNCRDTALAVICDGVVMRSRNEDVLREHEEHQQMLIAEVSNGQ